METRCSQTSCGALVCVCAADVLRQKLTLASKRITGQHLWPKPLQAMEVESTLKFKKQNKAIFLLLQRLGYLTDQHLAVGVSQDKVSSLIEGSLLTPSSSFLD